MVLGDDEQGHARGRRRVRGWTGWSRVVLFGARNRLADPGASRWIRAGHCVSGRSSTSVKTSYLADTTPGRHLNHAGSGVSFRSQARMAAGMLTPAAWEKG